MGAHIWQNTHYPARVTGNDLACNHSTRMMLLAATGPFSFIYA